MNGEDNTRNNLNHLIKFVPITAACAIAVLIAIYFIPRQELNLDLDAGIWGAVGDFFGGILNPILSFLTIILLVSSLKYQNLELRASTKALEDTKDIHNDNLLTQQRNILIPIAIERFDKSKKEINTAVQENLRLGFVITFKPELHGLGLTKKIDSCKLIDVGHVLLDAKEKYTGDGSPFEVHDNALFEGVSKYVRAIAYELENIISIATELQKLKCHDFVYLTYVMYANEILMKLKYQESILEPSCYELLDKIASDGGKISGKVFFELRKEKYFPSGLDK